MLKEIHEQRDGENRTARAEQAETEPDQKTTDDRWNQHW